MAFIFFLIVVNSYESIANKSLALAQFVVLMLVMFRPSDPAVSARAGACRPSAAVICGSNARD